MRWSVFIIVTYVALAIEPALGSALGLEIARGAIRPSLLLILMAFIASWAPPLPAAIVGLALGLGIDLLSPMTIASDGQLLSAIPGPHAVGGFIAAYAVNQVRSVLYRDSILSLPFMTAVVCLFTHLTAVLLLTLRAWPLRFGVPGLVAHDELFVRFLSSLYTIALSLPIGWLMIRAISIWGFEGVKSPGRTWRGG